MPRVEVAKSAKKALRRVPDYVFEWTKEVVKQLSQDPYIGQALQMPRKVEDLRCFKLRKGDYRLVYCYSPSRDTVFIVAIDHRSKVYREFKKWLARE